jgi:hypothetical protein
MMMDSRLTSFETPLRLQVEVCVRRVHHALISDETRMKVSRLIGVRALKANVNYVNLSKK